MLIANQCYTVYRHTPTHIYLYTAASKMYSTLPILQSVYKIRPPITQPVKLILIQRLYPPIPLPAQTLPVLSSQKDVLYQGTAEQEQNQVCQNSAMTRVEPRAIFTAVNIRRDDSVEVTPADDEANCYAAFVDSCFCLFR